MKKIYLNDQLKKYYSNSLEEEIALKKIDKGLIIPLRLIKNCKNIRPVFSKKNKDIIGKNNHSYLCIAFESIIEEELLKAIRTHIVSKYNSRRKYECSCTEIKPYVREEKAVTENNKGSKWQTDSEYFNISQIRIDLKKGSSELHDEFWNELSTMLSNLF